MADRCHTIICRNFDISKTLVAFCCSTGYSYCYYIQSCNCRCYVFHCFIYSCLISCKVFQYAADFGGYKDFILDNLVIEKSKAQKVELEEIVAANSGRYEVNYTPESWEVFEDAMEAAHAVLEDFAANQTTLLFPVS